MAEQENEYAGLLAQLEAEEAQQQAAQAQQATDTSFVTNLNYGLATIMGLPVDLPTAGLKLIGALPTDYDPIGGAVSIRNGMREIGMALPQEGTTPEGFRARAGRLTGESALPAGGLFAYGGALATKAASALTPFQASLVSSFNNPVKTAVGEGAAILGATIGGETAEKYFPDSHNAGLLGELFGAMTPAVATQVVTALPSARVASVLGGKVGEKVTKLRDDFTPAGSRRRAERRARTLAANPQEALGQITTDSILQLDPLTQSGDVGLMSLLKAVEAQGQKTGSKFADDIANITEESMKLARTELMSTGNPEKVTEYFENLLTATGARAARAIQRLEADATDIQVARSIREEIEKSYSQASNVEDALYAKLPTNGRGDASNITETFKGILDSRSASADPDDIPNFVYELIGDYKKPSKSEKTGALLTSESVEPVFKEGTSIKNPDLANLKDLRSRLGKAVRAERVKPVPNRRKIQILSELREEVLNTLQDISPDYADAVAYSRELNQKFTQGRIGELLSLERRGADRVTPEGTLGFLVSGNADQVRLGMEQLKEASPQAVQEVERGIKAMFGAVAKTDSGAFNTTTARQFLKNNKALFESFPVLKRNIENAIKQQRLTDELAGAQIGESVSKFAKHKSVASVFLNEDVNTAMRKLLTNSSGAGQAQKMKSMIDFVKRDQSGEALDGLKSSFGQLLINMSAGKEVGMLSGKALQKNLEQLAPAAKQLFNAEELGRFNQIASELRKIELREGAKAAEGGIISDTPNKILSILSRVGAAQIGRKVAERTGGGTVQTPGIFTGEAKEMLAKLTNDGAAQLLIGAIKDKELLADLLKGATPENLRLFQDKYSSIIPATSVGGIQATESLINDDKQTKSYKEASEPSLEELLRAL